MYLLPPANKCNAGLSRALLTASHFQWNDLEDRKEMGMMVAGETGSQRKPQALESDRCEVKSRLFCLLAG